MTRIYLFKRFERFWHWAQAALIGLMLLTGFEIHGVYALAGWDKAVNLHSTAAWALMTLWLFAIFWHFTTGEWRQYIPTMRKVGAMMQYYLHGIFTGAPHPYDVTAEQKHNPLQRLVYLKVKMLILPMVGASGLLYLFYNEAGKSGIAVLSGLSLGTIALVHTAAAFLTLVFLIVHMYLATAGHTPLAHIKAMITGWHELEEHAQSQPVE
ncbi:MAG TPA: cytochrome b/b6 domain-containing protein [Noviherbaspirillum sp.]|uniref:cytochrome b/b6 domain-containing protein n=1 Tax=Noviherbaspirillum sp. TaxID=1926288 RepID=UPI002B4A5E63|nr:cytochrome b/b6 domain-containing protein [Noviherbaspirillum sp.]HJV85248.1 cytochrome b/b6 domain-containing protein [Noviherbaspirillum sp.]